MNEHKYWLGFSLIPNIGPKRLQHLFEHFGSLSQAWSATVSDLNHAGLGKKLAADFAHLRSRLDLDAALNRLHKAGAQLLTLGDDDYPSLLRQIDDPPAVLYIRGNTAALNTRAISIVGTRKATKYGRDVAFDLSRQLASQNITVVSGLAPGIDAAAHQGALAGEGFTLAVMGCGVDVPYPRENVNLARQISALGALISEYPVGTQPIPANFPRRNRILSGLSLGVLVVEAPENSGALITANLAADQGREVFAIPGAIYNQMSRGSNRLIQDGAKLVQDVADILSELNIAHEKVETRERTQQIAPGSENERLILQHLNVQPVHVDDLARLTSLSIADVTSTLTILELKGLAQMVGPMQYSSMYTRGNP